jgi:hypothetical protein
MSISKDDASTALGEINAAGLRLQEIRAYGRTAPFLIIWGVVWMVCDVGVQFAPGFGYTWMIGVVLGTIASFIAGAMLRRPKSEAGAGSWRYFATWMLVMGFISALFFIVPVTSAREVHSVFGLVFGFIYVGMGFWTGWRLIALGAALVGLTFIGFYEVGVWYSLYMGLVSGGALLLGGLWLRKI